MSELLTAVERAMIRVPVVNDPNTIPPMKHPYGQHCDSRIEAAS